MRYTYTTPECVDSKWHNANEDEIKEVLNQCLEEHGDMVCLLGREGQYIIDWTKPMHMRGWHVILQGVSDSFAKELQMIIVRRMIGENK